MHLIQYLTCTMSWCRRVTIQIESHGQKHLGLEQNTLIKFVITYQMLHSYNYFNGTNHSLSKV